MKETMNRSIYLRILILFVLVAMPGCVDTAAESPALSEEIGTTSSALGTQPHLLFGHCQTLSVPVTLTGYGPANVYAELCIPWRQTNTVELLVHGSTYDHDYWDFPLKPWKYSHVRDALREGYATLNIDRVGTGLSTIPPSTSVTVDGTVDYLHEIAQKLKAGQIGPRSFSKVVYFGSSLTVVYGWLLGQRYPADADGFVFEGLVHMTRPGFLGMVLAHHRDPACGVFPQAIDCGYVTTTPGWRDDFFYHVPGASPDVIAKDEETKSFVSDTLVFESAQYTFGPGGDPTQQPDPATAPSQGIVKPVLIAFGAHDATACGTPPDGIVCTNTSVHALEAPYFTNAPSLDVYVPANTGHALPLHESGPVTAHVIDAWLDHRVGR